MIKKLGLVVLALLVVLLVIIVTRPPTFEVKRSTEVKAPPAIVYGLVDDFHAWGQWSPWDKLDPAMVRTYSGPERGTGAVYHWKGNKQAGEGSMTITSAKDDAHLTIDLEFIEPFPAKNRTDFDFAPGANGVTTVTWAMSGEHTFVSKAMSLVMNMDKMVGPDFEAGLAKLKELAEKEATRRTEAAAQKAAEPADPAPAPAQ